MEKHFVKFFSPGIFVHEETEKEINSWDVEVAKEMSKVIIERHQSHPFAFQFITRGRSDTELNSKVVNKSGLYYINGIVKTLQEIEAENDPENETLLWNMRVNKYNKVVTTTSPWEFTSVFNDEDCVVEI